MSVVFTRIRYALLQELRSPARLLPTLGLPVMILSFFYLPYVQDSEIDATLQTGGIVVLALTISYIYSLSVKIAHERDTPWRTFATAMPVRAGQVLVAEYTATLIVGLIGAGIAVTVSIVATPASIPAELWARTALSVLVGTLPVALLAIAIGYMFAPRGAIAATNLVFWPLAFISGLFLPPQELPTWAAAAADYSPVRQWYELVRTAVTDRPTPWDDVAGIATWTAALALVALAVLRRDVVDG
jgi:ABC-2 type transport system permease protein